MIVSGVSDRARWALDQVKVMRREGATSHEVCHEVNRLLYGKASCPDCEKAADAHRHR